MAKTTRKPAPDGQIARLEDELKAARQRIDELKQERDEAYELVERMNQHVDVADAVIQSWIEVDQLQLGDNGYRLKEGMGFQLDELARKYRELQRDWNKFVDIYNATINPRDVGRPLAASKAQCAQILKLHAEGNPLRLIVDEVKPLGLQTIRTVIGRKHRTDRTSVKRMRRELRKVEIDRSTVASEKSRKRTRDALPKRIKATLDEGAELIKEARGLGKVRS